MRRRTYVFAGLSLDRAAARKVFPGAVLPPAGPGDLSALLADERPPAAIGIVDTLFPLAVTPKEVTKAIKDGVIMYGAGGVGALRALECAAQGMIGVGRVYEMYRTGEVTADDEVLTSFDPLTLIKSSQSMVDIREAMVFARQSGLVSPSTATAAIKIATAMHYTDRTYEKVALLLQQVVSAAEIQRYRTFVACSKIPQQQRSDALEMLASILRQDQDSSSSDIDRSKAGRPNG